MARDPFAPVVQSSVPKWIWIVVGGFAFLLISLGTTMAVVVSKRTANAAKPVAAPVDTPAVAAPTPAPAVAANAPAAAAGEEKGEKPEKSSTPHKHKSSGGGGSKKPAESKPAAPAAPPKPKKVMEQKDIDKLLGL